MLQKFKLTMGQWLNNPNTRVILVLTTLILATLVAGAPDDGGW